MNQRTDDSSAGVIKASRDLNGADLNLQFHCPQAKPYPVRLYGSSPDQFLARD